MFPELSIYLGEFNVIIIKRNRNTTKISDIKQEFPSKEEEIRIIVANCTTVLYCTIYD